MNRKYLLFPLLLAACSTETAFNQEGVSVSRLSNDYAACLTAATSQAPVDVQEQTTYDRTFGFQGCRSAGCNPSGGWEYERSSQSVDVNAGNRDALVQQCMVSRGYSVAQLPACAGGVAGIDASYRQPAISGQSCVAQLSGVGPVIVTP